MLEQGFDFCCIVWKRRTGWTPMVSSQPWQPRTLAIQGNFLQYYENGQEDGPPRGQLDLLNNNSSSSSSIQLQVIPPNSEQDGPTPHQIHIRAATSLNNKPVLWKLCFDQQSDLMTCLSHIHSVLEQHYRTMIQQNTSFEHDFQTADHIYRWEMIVVPPVIYPIQIHGIVLEAGRNCVVVADFGLTGYSRKQGTEFHHVDDDEAQSHSTSQAVLAAFHKLRPTQQDQRLRILTLIDPKEIRKWTKAKYDQESLFHHHSPKAFQVMSSWIGKLRVKDEKHINPEADASYHGDLPTVRVTSNESSSPPTQPKQHKTYKPAKEVLPQSDPPEIVLARAHFLLEHMNVLPPYHVFYSNSECIAVWCKTGRWSTLQTAVFLGTNSVGAAKSSTLATLGVAAANPLLAPVVALGGLIWVTAPMYILKKSREKWQEITEYMTDVFWSMASSKVFVAAIQHWSGLVAENSELLESNGVEKKEKRSRRLENSQRQLDDRKQEENHRIDSQQEIHAPLAPPPMMAPPPPPRSMDDPVSANETSLFEEDVSPIEPSFEDETTDMSPIEPSFEEETTDMSPIQPSFATDASPIDESTTITHNEVETYTNGGIVEATQIEKGLLEASSIDDGEPIEPPADIQETPSTEAE